MHYLIQIIQLDRVDEYKKIEIKSSMYDTLN